LPIYILNIYLFTFLLILQLLDPNDKVGRYLASRFTWYILPVVNPDGYSYTWTAVRRIIQQFDLVVLLLLNI